MRRVKATICLAALLALVCLSTATHAWGPQGHRLVAMIAATYLTGTARQHVSSLLGAQTLADVAVWADQYPGRQYPDGCVALREHSAVRHILRSQS